MSSCVEGRTGSSASIMTSVIMSSSELVIFTLAICLRSAFDQ